MFYSCNFSTLDEWIRISEAYAMHHSSDTVDEDDVRQAARILLNIDCSPRFLDFNSSKTSYDLSDTIRSTNSVMDLMRKSSECCSLIYSFELI